MVKSQEALFFYRLLKSVREVFVFEVMVFALEAALDHIIREMDQQSDHLGDDGGGGCHNRGACLDAKVFVDPLLTTLV